MLSGPIRRFLGQEPRYATIATVNPDGSPHQVVVWYLLRDDHLVLNSRAGRRWPTNLLRDPRLSFTVEEGLDFVTLAGEVEVERDAERTQADIAEMARRYETPDVAERSIAEFGRQQRLSFRFRPRSVHTHGEIEEAAERAESQPRSNEKLRASSDA
ncbi:MAG: pyridoxamine 5'-phosphate oxidase family protein [Chloroflexota bacterium]|nr:pyridoxamine 5'-phosphate oxidase family protein [Chloroflexota bacterium]